MKVIKLKLSALERKVIHAMRVLPLDKQEFVLEFSLFMQLSDIHKCDNNKPLLKRQAGLGKGSAWICDECENEISQSL